MGARPLRRAIQRYIEDPLADFVLKSELIAGATVMVEPAPEGDEREMLLSGRAAGGAGAGRRRRP
jgi:ATP-dependent Clp protease ATP-binding subunit ClpC